MPRGARRVYLVAGDAGTVGGTVALQFPRTGTTVTGVTLGAPLSLPDSGLFFSADTDTSIQRVAPDQILIFAGGAPRASFGPNGVALVGQFQLGSVITPAAISGATHNWNPPGLATAQVIRVSGTNTPSITGIAAQPEGTRLTLINVGTQSISLPWDDAGSTAANRLVRIGTARTLSINGRAELWYDTVTDRWRVSVDA